MSDVRGETLAPGLVEGARALAVPLSAEQVRVLTDYLALLDKWNQVYNLTAIRDARRMVTHHLLDSLAVLPALGALSVLDDDLRILDVGSGGGLPGIPLAIARPRWQVALCEPSHKKATFLTQAIAELPLRNVEVAAVRVEDYCPAKPFDLVLSRAFSDLVTFAQAAGPHLRTGGAMVAMKGVMPEEELAELPDDIEVIARPALAVPGLAATRHLIVMKRKEDRP